MSELTKCIEDIIAGLNPTEANAIEYVLKTVQEQTIGSSLEKKIGTLCGVQAIMQTTFAKLQNEIDKVQNAVDIVDAKLAAAYCPDLSALSSCFKKYKAVLVKEQGEINLAAISTMISDLNARKDDVEKCGVSLSNFLEFFLPDQMTEHHNFVLR